MTPQDLAAAVRPMPGAVLTIDYAGIDAGRLVGVKLESPGLVGLYFGEEPESRAELTIEEAALFLRWPTADDERRELSRHAAGLPR